MKQRQAARPWWASDVPPCGRDPHPEAIRRCLPCRAIHQRRYRRRHTPTTAERAAAYTRWYSMVLEKRGLLIRRPCRDCCGRNVQRHHPLIENPYYVVWLCPPCHRAEHKKMPRRRAVPSGPLR